MKKLLLLVALAVFAAPAAFAQNHGEIGIFGEYFRNSPTSTNFGGVGGRVSVNPWTHVALEADMSYDFQQVFNEGFTSTAGGSVTFQQTPIRVLHASFGPKFQTGGGPVRLFATLKGGIANFRFDPRPAAFSTFTSSFDNLRSDNVRGVFYPGGGAEAYLWIIGLRLDVGDEMYFQNGTHHNLRVTFGPHIRF